MPAETDLAKALAAIGESAPEGLGMAMAGSHVAELEALALRLAVRLAEAERCRVCNGTKRDFAGVTCVAGEMQEVDMPCAACSGTGKEQPR